jgi:sec-independent protein translocase protein TatA
MVVSLVVGWEWIVIILAVIVLLLWGPSKIPELARGLGQAKAEFERASKGEYPTESRRSGASRLSDDEIILIAKSLGITTEGKTRDEIFQEIIASIKAAKAPKSDLPS